MPRYEFRCRTCDATFEEQRPMAQSDAPAPCPQGHDDTVRLISVFAATTPSSGALSGLPARPPAGGGCGGACACH